MYVYFVVVVVVVVIVSDSVNRRSGFKSVLGIKLGSWSLKLDVLNGNFSINFEPLSVEWAA